MLQITQLNRKIELKFWSVFHLVVNYPAIQSLIRWLYELEKKLAWRKTQRAKDLALWATCFTLGTILGYFVILI